MSACLVKPAMSSQSAAVRKISSRRSSALPSGAAVRHGTGLLLLGSVKTAYSADSSDGVDQPPFGRLAVLPR